MPDKSPIVIGFATTNPHKLRETAQCCQAIHPGIQVIALPPTEDVEETGATFCENAIIKLQASLAEGIPPEVTHVIAEDAGLVIPALDGRYGLSPFPGIQSHRWFSQQVQMDVLGQTFDNPGYIERNAAILKLVADNPNRKAQYVACIACWIRETETMMTETGTCDLWIAEQPQGENGFGYDPIMIPVDTDRTRTMAELPSEEKNRLSHRRKALEQLIRNILSASIGTKSH